MRIVNLRDAKASLSAVVDQSQGDRILITRHGKPAALVIGVEGEDLEDLMIRANPEFWEMIERRRASRRPRVTLEEIEKRLGLGTRSPKRRAVRRSRSGTSR